MSDILLEVDDDLRNQKIKQVWDKYGQWIIAVVTCVILATAIGAYWHAHVTRELEKQTAELLSVLQNEAEDSDTIQKLVALRPETRAPLNAVVDLYHAQKLEQAGSIKPAQDAYKAVIDNNQAEAITRDLARVHYVRLGLVVDADDNAASDAAALLAVIEPVTKKSSAFRGTALELKGLLLLKQDKTEQANDIFKALSNDETVPTSLRNRAKTLVVYDEAEAKNAQ